MAELINLESFCQLATTYEGRDKITKLFQFFTKFLSWWHLKDCTTTSLNYLLISEKVKETRQLFRIFKFLFEIKRIQLIYNSNTDKFSRIMNISSRGFYFLYYALDNLYIYGKCTSIHKRTTNFSLEKLRQLSRIFWFLGLLLLLIYTIKTIRKTYTDESDLKVAALNKMTVK